MPYQTGIVTALRDYGLKVELYRGWQTRGSSSFAPRCAVVHHDAIPTRWVAPPSILINGRSDLPGPLCNFALNAAGTVWMIAAGRANHAGTGGWHGCVGNSSAWGTEAQNAGTGSQVWPDAQLDAYVALNAACCDFSNFDPSMVCRHAEWTSRKIDAAGPWQGGGNWSDDMGRFRLDVKAVLDGGLPMSAVSEINENTNKRIAGVRAATARVRKTQLIHGKVLASLAHGQKVGLADLKDLTADNEDVADDVPG